MYQISFNYGTRHIYCSTYRSVKW